MRRPNLNKQDFPMMIYHCVLGTKIIADTDELKKYIEAGWSQDFKVIQDYANKKAKIEYHKAELLKLGVDTELSKEVLSSKTKVIAPVKKRAKPK